MMPAFVVYGIWGKPYGFPLFLPINAIPAFRTAFKCITLASLRQDCRSYGAQLRQINFLVDKKVDASDLGFGAAARAA